MSLPIQGMNPNLSTPTNTGGVNSFVAETKENLQEAKSAMKDIVKAEQTIDSEVSLLNSKDLGVKDQTTTQTIMQQAKAKQAQHPDQTVEELAAQIQSQDEIKKKNRRKKAKFEEKMEELAGLKDAIDVEQLNGEEQGIIQEFFKNMSRIKSLKGQLKQIESDERRLEDLLSEKENKERERQRKRREEAMKKKKRK